MAGTGVFCTGTYRTRSDLSVGFRPGDRVIGRARTIGQCEGVVASLSGSIWNFNVVVFVAGIDIFSIACPGCFCNVQFPALIGCAGVGQNCMLSFKRCLTGIGWEDKRIGFGIVFKIGLRIQDRYVCLGVKAENDIRIGAG